MNIESFQQFCLSLPEVTEEFPFGEDTLVFKVRGKMFALTNLELFESINLKCNPDEAVELRERYPSVTPGYHMNKKHWNTIIIDNTISDTMLYKWIRDSYDLVLAGMPKRK
ncbi:MmcQ/YjbR family DNA-binding protein [Flavihumibacter profundi]|uniref:MmcQ/YjbR family DNA-binding protein n=1 Tax=Flavihumibacter profundi TaxID=2716883 RepID=UPI001CC62FAD|nr:MmcQ/YjbR family DNA-binding protein [Flavihumibacter profundi]MBZ5859158.1 MmcQ/YjbR family DNA-binding protein [Flavihumibacter profundi]